jgi:hypothetical protein
VLEIKPAGAVLRALSSRPRRSKVRLVFYSFCPKPPASSNEFLQKSFGAMTGDDDYEAWATDKVRGRRWHPDQVVTELADGRSVFACR